MDDKQFNLFAQAIQWVKDEAEFKSSQIRHHQGAWGLGWIKGKIDVITKGHHYGVSYVEVCPTACCVAGNIVLANGDKFVHMVAPSIDLTGVTGEGGIVANVDYCLTAEGTVQGISARAQELTGIDEAQAERLFAGANSPGYVIDVATRIAADHGHTLELV